LWFSSVLVRIELRFCNTLPVPEQRNRQHPLHSCTKIEDLCITRQSAKWQTLASAPAVATLAMSRRYPGARPPLDDLLEEGKKAGTRAKDGQPKKEPSARKDGSLVPPPPTLAQLGLTRNEASECLKLAAQKRKSERPGPRRHQPS
jgi:hypothetical protein